MKLRSTFENNIYRRVMRECNVFVLSVHMCVSVIRFPNEIAIVWISIPKRAVGFRPNEFLFRL